MTEKEAYVLKSFKFNKKTLEEFGGEGEGTFFFTGEKVMIVQSFIREGLMSGEITGADTKLPNYNDVYLTEKGEQALNSI